MPPDVTGQPRSEAITQLEALGLSAYAARTFVALAKLGDGTAKDVSYSSEVPRTRVYDAVEELRDRGLVDVQQSTPKRFWAVSSETMHRQFTREYTHRVNGLTEALDSLESRSSSEEQRGVWTVTGRETVSSRVMDFIDAAEAEIVYMTVEALLTEEIVEQLRVASDRGVSIKLAGLSESVEATLRDEIPEAEVFESMWEWSETPAGRLLMVDQGKTLVSVQTSGADDRPPRPGDETAIWGSGTTNGLVVVLKAMFTWQLDDTRG